MNIYIKIYESKVFKKLPKGYEVHHIDLNRENNHISNLVALPKELHVKYHKLRHFIDFNKINDVGSLIDVPRGYNYFLLEKLKELIMVIDEINEFIDFRDYLIGSLIVPYQGKIYY